MLNYGDLGCMQVGLKSFEISVARLPGLYGLKFENLIVSVIIFVLVLL